MSDRERIYRDWDAAIKENEMYDLHIQALQDNHDYDHEMALKENEVYDAHVAALEEDRFYNCYREARAKGILWI